jgi:hypothetical protein
MDSVNDALIEAVKACGGSKAVAPRLWPTLGVEQAQRKLLDSLNPDRPHRLAPDEVFAVLRLARDAGKHAPMAYLCDVAGYSVPQPVTRADEENALRRDLAAIGQSMTAILSRLERLESTK